MPGAHSRIAITGGAGFIGRHFARRFSALGIPVSTLDLRAPAEPTSDERVIVGDVRDPLAVRTVLEGADKVLHLAAAHHDFGIERETFFSVNEGGTRTLCSGMDEAGIREVCFFSSVAVYGPEAESPDESSQCRPDSHYGESKLEAEHRLGDWAQRGEARSVLVIRPTVTFGPGNFANMYTLIRQIASGVYLPVGPGANRKSLVYVDNVVAATLELWLERSGDAAAVRIFNAVDKPDLSSREIEEAVFRGLNRRSPRLRVPLTLAKLAAQPFDAVIAITGRNLPISTARIKKFAEANTVFGATGLAEAGIEQKVSLVEGIRRMVDWYCESGRFLPIDRSVPPSEVVPLRVADHGVPQ